jgi:hypothetical protein
LLVVDLCCFLRMLLKAEAEVVGYLYARIQGGLRSELA